MTDLSFGTWLRRRRRSLDLTQAELGQRVGCSAAAIRKMEAGERRPSEQLAARLALHLQLESDGRDAFLRAARGVNYLSESSSASSIKGSKQPFTLPLHTYPRLIGRDTELAAATQTLLQPQNRLLTLTGAPGVGKTRLAMAVADSVGARFADGACFVDLTSTADSALVEAAIAQALSLPQAEPDTISSRLCGFLQQRHLLLVLDGMEHLTAAAPLLVHLLSNAPAIKLLITSQIALHLSAEAEISIGPLRLPEDDAPLSVEKIVDSPAVALFLARARTADPHFGLSDQNIGTIVALCRYLDGLPLAIELAAARCRHFSPHDLLERIDQLLTLLKHERSDVLLRHRSLLASIAWSVSLLSEEHIALFRRIAIFNGGCTIEAIMELFGQDTQNLSTIVESIAVLVDHSLLQRQTDLLGRSRYVMLECIRSYAMNQLTMHNEVDTFRQRHAVYYSHAFSDLMPDRWDSAHHRWVLMVDIEYANLRAALEWSSSTEAIDVAGHLAVALESYWVTRGMFDEGRYWFATLLAHSNRLPDPLQVKLLASAGEIAFQQSDYQKARDYFAQSFSLFRMYSDERQTARVVNRLGWIAIRQIDYSTAERYFRTAFELSEAKNDRHGSATALANLGWTARERGELEQAYQFHVQSVTLQRVLGNRQNLAYALNSLGWIARELEQFDHADALHAESLHIYQDLHDQPGIAHTLNNLAWVAGMRGDYGNARVLHERSLALRRELGNTRSVAWSLCDLAWIERSEKRYGVARRRYDEALSQYQALGDRRGIALVLSGLGWLAYIENNLMLARANYRESLILFRALGDLRGIAGCLEGVAAITQAKGESELAARLLGAAEGLRAKCGAAVPSQERSWYNTLVAAIESNPSSAVRTARADGYHLDLEDIMPLLS
jgi:predicted ATPase/transcriptional regulator with XRE-family HTH domain